MSEITSISMGNDYHDVILLDEYNGIISIVSGREGKDGKNYPQWVFPQDQNRKPREKAIPLKVSLGDRDNAIKHLRYLLDCLEAGEMPPVSDDMTGTSGIDDDSIPF